MTDSGRGHAYITGVGAVTPLGVGVENFWDAALHGKSGIGEITLFDPSPYPSRIAGECRDFDPSDFIGKKEIRRMDRYTQMGVSAGLQAVEDAGVSGAVQNEPERVAIIMGTGIGGLSTWEREYRVLQERGPGRVSPFLITMMAPNMCAGYLAILLGARGPTQCPVLACATGAEAVAEGLEMIRRGDADVVIAGSSEAPITPLSMAGFCAIRAVSRRNDDPRGASRPFDAGRDGFVMSEGAGALVLESPEHAERRGAEPIAAVSGYGRTTDAYHVTAPDTEGRGVERAMRLALEDAGVEPGEVGHVNAHATATPTGDGPETKAIARLLPHAAVSGTKSMTGHSFGAIGATEAIMCALALRDGVLPPTINLEEVAPDCEPLDYVRDEARAVPGLKAAISNSMGFGGHNVVVVFESIG
ncbi:beta-ketoacyl-ACP synthase II [Rubrobacter calidifluminis]|uniref:beta-ketoacyl-ACP synthase II n=1 Tax=Rubrobacter calidifluminis TaxID=1392640 RepID=UPI002361978B|nr:beta-ketoacyl-ACP synthase II [Rubrobacter calidifluminis]